MRVTERGLREIQKRIVMSLPAAKPKFKILNTGPGKFLVVITLGNRKWLPTFRDLQAMLELYQAEVGADELVQKNLGLLCVPPMVQVTQESEGGVPYYTAHISDRVFRPTLADLRAAKTMLGRALKHAEVKAFQVRARLAKEKS